MLNERFITYFRDTFFQWKEGEFEDFLRAIEKPIPRTIRIKPEMIEEVKNHLEKDGWILGSTNISNVFSLDRREDFNPLERRIGYSLDHLIGNFYIQELAAAHPVDILADGKVQEDEFLILDMASSPGGKTTQLAEYFPNSFIIANEPTRERIPQLLQNLERMSTPHVGVTLYPWQYWKNHTEIFDRILLDAPCSGEWTLYKWTDAVKHWHIKNIKQIARLQEKLLDAALHALKVWWEIIYSTCSLNNLEDEWVIASMYEKYENSFDIVFEKKFWPHIDNTWGFYVVKIRKTQSLPREEDKKRISWNNEKLHPLRGNINPWKIQEKIDLYTHDKKILATKNTHLIRHLLDSLYFMRFGENIWHIDNGKFSPSSQAHRHLEGMDTLRSREIIDEGELDLYLRWYLLEDSVRDDGHTLMTYKWETIALEESKNGEISNTFPHDWRRK